MLSSFWVSHMPSKLSFFFIFFNELEMIICLEKGDSLFYRYDDVDSRLVSVISSCISLSLQLENPQNIILKHNGFSQGFAK